MEEDNIKIKIKSINNEEYELCVKQNMNTEELKSILAEKKNVNKNDIRLIYQGQCLSNEKTISDYNIQNDHIIHLVVRKRENANNDGDNKNDNINTNPNRINENIINDPLNINFASHMNQNNSSSTNTTNNASPFYFTHMRLTRNDNLENDLMGQNNIYSLLNDIMSQVNINPSFIYGAAAATSDNIFTNSMNQNMNDYSNNRKENKKNEEDNSNKETNIKKDEEKKQKIKNSNSVKKNDDNTNLEIDQKKDREKKGKGKIIENEEEEGKNRDKKKMINNQIEKEGYNKNEGREYKEKDKKEEEKEIKKKKKRKNINDEKKYYKNKNREDNKDYNFSDSKSSSSNESHSSNSGLSESDDTEEEEEERKKHAQRIKKKRTKNKYKKKKYYDYSSFTSDDEPFKKDERIRKPNGNAFDENYYYPHSYYYNSNIRSDNNNILKKKNNLSKYSYPFIGDALKGSYNEKQNYSYRDDFNEIYENINDNKIDYLLQKRERKKNIFSDYNKNMLNSTKRNTNNMMGINNNISNKNIHNCRGMLGMSNIIKNSNECISGGKDDCCYSKNYSNIIPLSDTERNNQIIRNDSFRTNSRIAINEPVVLSSNNSVAGNMRSIQMTSNRRNSTLRRSEPKCLNDINDSEYKNVEINIPWRVIEQLLVLLEEETGYRRPDLSSYIHSYYNSNSIYVFFYLFVHINNIINSIIIQFNHANFLNNDISMSSFSRISLILSLASVIFSKLSNFFFVFYDNFYFPNYGNNYRNPDSINHEFLREIRNLYYSNNRNNNINNNRFYQNNNAHMNMDAYNQNSFSYPNNFNHNYYPLPYDMRNNCCNKTNLQQEFEDYYKNYLPYVKDSKHMILRKDNLNNNKDNNFNQNNSLREDNNNSNSKMSTGNKFYNKLLIENNEINEINNTFLKNDKIKENSESNNNSFLHLSNKNKSVPNSYKKKRNNEKEKEKKKHHRHYNENGLFKDIDSYKSDSIERRESSSDSSNNKNKKNNIFSDFNSNNPNMKEKKENIMENFHSKLKSTNNERTNEKNYNKNFPNEINLNNIENRNDKDNALNTLLNNNLIFYDSNIDDIYDLSEDGKEKGLIVEKKEETKKNKNTDNIKEEKQNDNVIEKKKEILSESNKTKNVNSISPLNVLVNQNDNNIINDNKNNSNKSSIPNLNLSSILNNAQNQMTNNTKEATANDNFEGVPDEVKERYKNWVENSQIFSGQMIKICKNKRPLSNAYVGGNASKDDISYSNLLQFLWKRNMSTLNVNLNLEVTEELLNSFDFHTLEFIMKSIKNNEDYKTEKFKYPNIALCEELFEEIERKKQQ
ncbi:ubiquitin-like protein, putative [Plasmodium gallinaceum]|uniref:Ubiquitin-like protein, putative n=1 Tax=Plasmodium gallinaceum TaxID=5849 RepID=A0A1J1GW50_PLAGA|nr:ubiquitin-like protein, putative [Plasmodium gallinaceum]CRG96768.1 ubiquitin-like protein, putative [Plasmodium gallinaceum]